MKIPKVVQGTYISREARKIFNKHADAQNISTCMFASLILEKEAKRLSRKEGNNEAKADNKDR